MKKIIGPKGEEPPENPIDQAFTVARILTGEMTEEEVKKELEARDDRDDSSATQSDE